MIHQSLKANLDEPKALRRQGRLRVLLVEDSAVDAAIFQKQILKERGETVWIFHVKTLRAATKVAKKGSFDLIVLDLSLPDSNGLGTVSILKESCPQLPIIVLTGTEDEMVQRRALELGAEDYVIKNSMTPTQFWLSLTSTFSRFHRHRIETQIDAIPIHPTRAIFEDRINTMVSHSLKDRLICAVMLIEITQNEGQSFSAKYVEKMLSRNFRSSDTLFQTGEKTFGLVFDDIKDIKNAESIAQKLEICLKTESSFKNVYIGGSVFPLDGRSGPDLIFNAEAALRTAKKENTSVHFYSPLINQHLIEMTSAAQSIEQALARHHIASVSYPILDLTTREIYGFEVESNIETELMAGAHSDLRFKVFSKIFDQITSEMKAWQHLGWKSATFYFNLDEADLYDTAKFDNLCSWVERGLVYPESLCFEIPENLLGGKSGILADRLNFLKTLEVQLALSHYGEGSTPISFLRKFPFDSVKIHTPLIENLTRSGDNFKIVKAIIESAHAFEKKVIAGDVKTPEQLNLLCALRCDFGQGPRSGESIIFDNIREYYRSKFSGRVEGR